MSTSVQSVSTSRFVALKHFLSSNSFKDAHGQAFVFPGLLLCAIEEVQEMHTIENEMPLELSARKKSTKVAAITGGLFLEDRTKD